MIKVLMCCSTLDTKGGMVSVTKNYLGYKDWGKYEIRFIPTHFDANKYVVILYFGIQFIKIVFSVWFGNYKIAHLHTAERGSFWRKTFLMRFFHRYGIKVVLHHHAAEFDDFYNKCSRKRQEKIRSVLEEADVNIVLSKRLIPMIKDKASKANVEVLYNAVNTFSQNLYNNESKNILFLGRLGKRKGVFDLLESIKALDARIDEDVKFCLCGDGAIEEVNEYIKKLGIEHRIAYIGWIDGRQKYEILKNTMINVLPSYNEGLPMTILETMAYGIPNISTNIASIPEIISDGENGCLISPGDVVGLINCLSNLIVNEELRKKYSTASYKLISEKFSLDTNISILKEIYRRLE